MKEVKRAITTFMIMVMVIANVFIASGVAVYTSDSHRTPSGIPVSELEQFLDTHMAEYIGITHPGAAVVITYNGKVILSRSYGYADIEHEIMVDEYTVFEWGSTSKLFTWLSVMQLVEQGRLDLNADIREYLPDNFFRRLKYDTPITMYNLMHHNAGWGVRNTDIMTLSPHNIISLEEALRRAEPNQIRQPGTVISYCNYGVGIAGYIVERISRQPFYEYVYDNILSVLGMNDTAVHPIQTDNPSVAERRNRIRGYDLVDGELVPSKLDRFYVMFYTTGGAIGTTNDAAKFLKALTPTEGESSPLFNDNATLDRMLSTSFTQGDGASGGIAHGFFEARFVDRAFGHTGSLPAFASRLYVSPESGFGFFMAVNRAGQLIMQDTARAVLGEHFSDDYQGVLPDIRKIGNIQTAFSFSPMESQGDFQRVLAPLLSHQRFEIVDENTLRFLGIEFTQVRPFVFMYDDGAQAVTLYLTVESGNIIRVTMFQALGVTDLIPVAVTTLFAMNISLVIFGIGIIYIFIAVFISIINAIRSKVGFAYLKWCHKGTNDKRSVRI